MEVSIAMPAGHDSVGMTGSGERNLKLIREALGVAVSVRDGSIVLRGEEPELGVARRVFDELGELRVMDVILPTSEGIEIRRRCISRPNEHQAIFLERLGLQLPRYLETTEM
mgnify:CR=1 FL=1